MDSDDAEVALAVVDGKMSDEVSVLASQRLGLVDQLESVKSILRAFDALETGPVRGLTPPPIPVWGPFKLTQEIGRGGFGVVCRAFDPGVERDVAVKLYRGTTLPQEPRMMGRVRHPNAVTVYGAAVHEGRPGIWMELIKGRTLADRVQAEGPLTPAEVVRIGAQLCAALTAVHEAELIHQDIKPRNVMEESGSGRIVLMDFGAGVPSEDDDRTSPSRVSGTPLYMAPEVVLGSRPSVQSDIYSLGVLLYYLLTGTYPLYAASLHELRALHERQRGSGVRRYVAALRELRPEVSKPLAQCVARALAPAHERYETAADFGAALQAAPLAVSAAGAWRWVAAAAVAAVTLAGGTWLVREALQPPAPPAVPVAEVPKNAAEPLPAVPAPAPESAGTEAAAAPASAAAAAEATYEVDVALMVSGASGNRRLRSGDRVRVGDRLVLGIEASRPLHVYVISQDETGEAHLLFPMEGCRVNPIPAGHHVLPGRCSGEEATWEIDSAGGREHFLLMASPVRLAKVEAKLADMARPEWASAETERGVGKVAKAPSEPAGRVGFRELESLAQAEAAPKARAEGLWFQEIVLENPAS
jgi:hypothetical protein